MPLELGPDVAVTTDAEGVVRARTHDQAPYTGKRGMKPADLAIAYLEQAAKIYGIEADISAKRPPSSGPDPADATPWLMLAEEKSLMGATTLGFSQVLGGLQVWEAGVSVLTQERPSQVISSQS